MGVSQACRSSRGAGRTSAAAIGAALALSLALALAPAAHAKPGEFTTSEVFGGFTPSAIAVADFNGSGALDLAIANEGEDGVSLLFNDGTGKFTPAPQNPPIKVGDAPEGLAVGQFDAGVTLDLASVNRDSGDVTVLLNDGAGNFTATAASPKVGASPRAIAAGQLGGPGGSDLAAVNLADNTVSLLLNDGTGTGSFLPAEDTATGLMPIDLVVADFGGDSGLDELMVANSGQPSVSPIFFPLGDPVDAGGYPISIAAGDFDGDATLDVAVANPSTPSGAQNEAQALFNQGSGEFSLDPHGPFSTGDLPLAVAAGNLGGDGDDLAIANNNSDDVTVLLNGGGGEFAQPVAVKAGDGPNAIAVADLNGDRLDDIAVTNEFSGQVSIMLNDPGSCGGKAVTVAGSAGDDRLRGTKRADVIAGYGGDDVIKGRGANDVLCGGPGDDSLHGQRGADRLLGHAGHDVLRGHGGPDVLRGHKGRDRLFGGKGADRCNAGRGGGKTVGC